MNVQVNELQVLEQNSNAIVEAFKTEGGAKALFDRIAEQARSVVPDLSTDKGRKAIASMARKVASTKTAFDAHGKELKEQYTVITNKIDADRKLFRDACDALRDEIRKPLTDWEEAREARIQAIKDRISVFDSGRVDAFSSSSLIKQVIGEVEAISIDESFEDFANEAAIKKDAALTSFKKSLEESLKREAEQAELERLRKEQLEREQRERDERIAKEAADKARLEAEAKALAEQRRVEREKQEAQEKAEREQREAAEREARLKAENEAALLREEQLKQQAIEREKQAEIDRQNAIEQERFRIEREQEAKEEADRKAEEARQKNQAHRKKICGEALQGLLDLGVDEAKAKDILQAINKGKVPHVSIIF
ncbi:hypothetical protein AYL20_01440 [Acinetobacter venetianus]|uniref:hypothetical protein n=1 Tax=Acinetobacter venetianus TaxID=52133 RepID=UPI0007757A9F|nr:hypothetical protein [Acinetobacter venetianus]KXO82687.1 hypothetical protein AYL20_01440 [Acinetobacter venetianus]